ncbi:MAG: helix-turn-helix domain-containing protein [Actinomycetota bacterium]
MMNDPTVPRPNGATLVLTIEEAAQALRIGRTAAYEAARRWLETGGAEGLPVVRLGRRLRVPCHALDRLLSGAALKATDG